MLTPRLHQPGTAVILTGGASGIALASAKAADLCPQLPKSTRESRRSLPK